MDAKLRRAADIDLDGLIEGRSFFPSPLHWSDQTLYFLLVDRFSDGKEGHSTPLAKAEDRGNAFKTPEDAERWRQAGKRFVGGNLKGIQNKLGYLKELGVSAIWISPVLKQPKINEYAYHGYGTQDFLQVDPRYGTNEDLRDLVAAAHAEGMYVILDIVLNHAANVFTYESGGVWNGEQFPVKGWNDAEGQPTIPFVRSDPEQPDSWPDSEAAVWPVELQDPEAFTRKGGIVDWENDPEFREGDFFDFRDIQHGSGGLDDYEASDALKALIKVYKYWMAYADLDGFRIDTVKHMDPGAVRRFAEAVQEFGQTLGKEDFFLVGEITGGRGFALDLMQKTGLDAALGIGSEPHLLESTVKGGIEPKRFFDLFTKSAEVPTGTDAWFQSHLVTVIDDHDQVFRGPGTKERFSHGFEAEKLALAAFALNLLTLGIPCLYYGSEQAFDGGGQGDDAEIYIREAMFGGEFGAFGSRGVHFFDRQSPLYRAVSGLIELRKSDRTLRRGRQYLRETSGDGENFGYPAPVDGPMEAVVAWSRILDRCETIVAINTDANETREAWVTVDGELHKDGKELRCVYSSGGEQTGCPIKVEVRNGAAIRIKLPPGGVAAYSSHVTR